MPESGPDTLADLMVSQPPPLSVAYMREYGHIPL